MADSLYLLAAYAITLPSVFIADQVAPAADLIAGLKVACIAAFAWHAAVLMQKRRAEVSSALALAAATGLLWTGLLVIYLYKEVTMMPFNFSLVMSSLDDAGRTLDHTFGEHGVLIAGGALVALAFVAIGTAWMLFRMLRARTARFSPGPHGAVVCLALLCYFAAGDLWYAAGELLLHPRVSFAERAFSIPGPFSVPDYSKVPVRSRDSVFIVQLESVNSFTVFERTADEAGFRARIAQPGLETIVKEGGGVLFPFFWANSTQTHRAWESILCAVSGNLGPAIALDPARLPRRSCLPRHLAGAGYSTVFLYSYFDLDFFNLAGFAKMAGFQDVAYGPKLMAEGDRRHEWAYDDCVFYDRAFEYLARHALDGRERVFAYFEVGMNHWPFTKKHPEAHPYRAPVSMLEHYLNSVAEQDHCLLTFWKRFRSLGRDDIHLFILPDHSVWVRGAPHQPDSAFATWMAYIPPARRAAEFKPRVVLFPTPSQAQLYPTLLELLEGTALPGSFAFSLRGEPAPPRYDDCHLLSDPYQRLIVRRSGQRAEFRLGTSEIVMAGAAAQTSDFWTFRERFACK